MCATRLRYTPSGSATCGEDGGAYGWVFGVSTTGTGTTIRRMTAPLLTTLALAAAVVTGVAVRLLETFCPEGLRDRSTEAKGKPRVGGLAVFLGLCVALPFEPTAWRIVLPVGLATAVGLYDDVRDSDPVGRLVLLVGVSTLAAMLLLLPPLGALSTDWGVILLGAAPLPLLFVLTVVGFDFIDGLDGLAAGLALVALLPVLVIAPSPWIAAGAVATAVYLATSNRPPARTLLGDAGSNGLGLLVALAVVHPNAGAVTLFADARADYFGPDPVSLWHSPLMLVGLVAIPLVDVATTFIRRVRVGDLPSGERGHMHYRLAELHGSNGLAVLELVGVGAICAAGGVVGFLMPWRAWEALAGVLVALSLLVWRTRATRPAPSDSR